MQTRRAIHKNSILASGAIALVVISGQFIGSWAGEPSELNDEFNNIESLDNWKVRDSVEGGAKTYESIEIGEGRDGWLTIVPKAENFWYQDHMGPMLYKEISGDFLVETRVATRSRNAAGEPPKARYNSAGLIVRDGNSKQGSQNWVVVNTGFQAKFAGSEAKNTVNSKSHLELQPGSHNGRVRMARIGSMIYCLRMLEGETKWTLIRQIDRPDLPKSVQVGPMCNGWSNAADLVAEFDYVRFEVPQDESQLTVVR